MLPEDHSLVLTLLLADKTPGLAQNPKPRLDAKQGAAAAGCTDAIGSVQ